MNNIIHSKSINYKNFAIDYMLSNIPSFKEI